MFFETRGSSLLSIFSRKPGEQGASRVWTGWKTQKAGASQSSMHRNTFSLHKLFLASGIDRCLNVTHTTLK